MKTFLTQESINKEIDNKLEQAIVLNKQAQWYLKEGETVKAILFCDLAEELVKQAEELKELRILLFEFSPLPIQEYHFIQGNGRVEEMVAIIDLN